jgi:hypothetical protein
MTRQFPKETLLQDTGLNTAHITVELLMYLKTENFLSNKKFKAQLCPAEHMPTPFSF